MTLNSASLLRAVKRCFRFQEAGLVGVIIVLGLLLTVFGGSVKVPVYTLNADGTRDRVMTTNSQGEQEPASISRNTFLEGYQFHCHHGGRCHDCYYRGRD